LPDYENPAKSFLENHQVNTLRDIIEYTDFLRTESGICATPPIDLSKIIARFGMHDPVFTTLPDQQGTTIPFHGIPQIIINDTDRTTRQRFTQAHELIELLFTELPGVIRMDRLKTNIFGTKKEKICQNGAANLLMPEESFKPRAQQLGISFQTAELLSKEFEVSLIASLFRLADIFSNKAAIVLWRMKNKPSEIKKKIPPEQTNFPGFEVSPLPSPKLRAEWCYGNITDHVFPDNKSIPVDSSVYHSWENETYAKSEETIPFPGYNHKGIIENKPISINDEKMILSLIQ